MSTGLRPRCIPQGRGDSNPQPPVLETGALPIEPLPCGRAPVQRPYHGVQRTKRPRLEHTGPATAKANRTVTSARRVGAPEATEQGRRTLHPWGMGLHATWLRCPKPTYTCISPARCASRPCWRWPPSIGCGCPTRSSTTGRHSCPRPMNAAGSGFSACTTPRERAYAGRLTCAGSSAKPPATMPPRGRCG